MQHGTPRLLEGIKRGGTEQGVGVETDLGFAVAQGVGPAAGEPVSPGPGKGAGGPPGDVDVAAEAATEKDAVQVAKGLGDEIGGPSDAAGKDGEDDIFKAAHGIVLSEAEIPS